MQESGEGNAVQESGKDNAVLESGEGNAVQESGKDNAVHISDDDNAVKTLPCKVSFEDTAVNFLKTLESESECFYSNHVDCKMLY